MSRKTRGQPKVLVVDDEPDLLELLEMTLSRMGLDTSRAESVAEAQRMLDREPFDLCLTDWNLPDGEGLRVVEHITQKALDVPVAVITAFGSPENAVAALKAGAFDYLAKPVALEQLRALVKQALKVPEKAQPILTIRSPGVTITYPRPGPTPRALIIGPLRPVYAISNRFDSAEDIAYRPSILASNPEERYAMPG